jgi:hypothetical protein
LYCANASSWNRASWYRRPRPRRTLRRVGSPPMGSPGGTGEGGFCGCLGSVNVGMQTTTTNRQPLDNRPRVTRCVPRGFASWGWTTKRQRPDNRLSVVPPLSGTTDNSGNQNTDNPLDRARFSPCRWYTPVSGTGSAAIASYSARQAATCAFTRDTDDTLPLIDSAGPQRGYRAGAGPTTAF